MSDAQTTLNFIGKSACALYFNQGHFAIELCHLIIGCGADRTGQAMFEDNYRALF